MHLFSYKDNTSILPQSKCPFGQADFPCRPQGLHGGCGLASAIIEMVDKGVNPNAGLVEQKNAVWGASTAEHKCKGAESFT